MTEDQYSGSFVRISDVVAPWAERSPNHPALVEAGGTWTYAELLHIIGETRAWLLSLGIRPGDRVMIVGENCRAFAALVLSVAGIDAWPVPVNAHLSAREIEAIQQHCGARRILFVTSASSHAAEHAKRHLASTEGPPELGEVAVGALVENVEPEPLEPNISERVAALIYTSGTTGLPKGVMLTHKNLLFTATGSARIRTLTPQDGLLGVLPMSHVVGLSTILIGGLLSGATVYLAPRFDPMAARVIMEKNHITILLGVPAMFAQFLKYAKMKKLDSLHFPSLRIMSCSGAPLDATVKSAVEKLFDMPLHHAYGISECSPNVTQTRVERPRTDLSAGEAFPQVELKVVGKDGRLLPDGEVGEVFVRGPNIMKGYYRAPEETAAAIDADGWFRTRDLGKLENGNLYLVGRSKDLIIRSGLNVYPAEVEAVLNGHPAVAQSAVVGRAVDGDEEIVAFVQTASGMDLTDRELSEYAAQRLAPYKRPSRIVMVSEMPTTATGKIKKAELAAVLSVTK